MYHYYQLTLLSCFTIFFIYFPVRQWLNRGSGVLSVKSQASYSCSMTTEHSHGKEPSLAITKFTLREAEASITPLGDNYASYIYVTVS